MTIVYCQIIAQSDTEKALILFKKIVNALFNKQPAVWPVIKPIDKLLGEALAESLKSFVLHEPPEHIAIKEQACLTLIAKIAKSRANPNYRTTDSFGDIKPLLHVAFQYPVTPAVRKALIDIGADPLGKDSDGHLAVDGIISACEAFRDMHATVDAIRMKHLAQKKTVLSDTPQKKAQAFFTCLDIAQAQREFEPELHAYALLLVQSGMDMTARDDFQLSPLMRTAKMGEETLAREILKHAPPIDAQDGGGNTALHWAAFKANPAILHVLLDAGADTQIKNNGTHLSAGAMQTAEELGYRCETKQAFTQHKRKVLLRDTFVLAGTPAERSAAFFACIDVAERQCGFDRQLRAYAYRLINSGMDMTSRDKNQNTPLIKLAGTGEEKLVREMLKHNPPLDAQGWSGYTALHSAGVKPHPKVIYLLLKAGADSMIRNDGWQPGAQGSTAREFRNAGLARDVFAKHRQDLYSKTAPIPDMKKIPFRPA